jgi:hypothetical protein
MVTDFYAQMKEGELGRMIPDDVKGTFFPSTYCM